MDPLEGTAEEQAAWARMQAAIRAAQRSPNETNLAAVRRTRTRLIAAMSRHTSDRAAA